MGLSAESAMCAMCGVSLVSSRGDGGGQERQAAAPFHNGRQVAGISLAVALCGVARDF